MTTIDIADAVLLIATRPKLQNVQIPRIPSHRRMLLRRCLSKLVESQFEVKLITYTLVYIGVGGENTLDPFRRWRSGSSLTCAVHAAAVTTGLF